MSQQRCQDDLNKRSSATTQLLENPVNKPTEPAAGSLERRLAHEIFLRQKDPQALIEHLQRLPRADQLTAQIVLIRQMGPKRGTTMGRQAFGGTLLSPPAWAGSRSMPSPAWSLFEQARAWGIRDVLSALLRHDDAPCEALLSGLLGSAEPRVAKAAVALLRDAQDNTLYADLDSRSGRELSRLWGSLQEGRTPLGLTGLTTPAPLLPVAERRAVSLFRMHASTAVEADGEHPFVEAALLRIGRGALLPEAIRKDMEARFHAPFDRVRIHTDAVADQAAQAVGARAFTTGEDIFFAAGTFTPDTPTGRELLAHELTHVLQAYQGRIPARSGAGPLRVSSPSDSLEQEARERGRAAAADQGHKPREHRRRAAPVPPREVRPPAALHRDEGDGSWWSEIGDWILGVLAGDFEEDPSISQIIVRTLLTLIPYVDQAGDVEDLVAACYKLIWQERYNEFDPWFGLVLSLFGLIPELGTAVKGVIKILLKSAGNLDLSAILKLLSRLGLDKHLDTVARQLDDLMARLPALKRLLAERARGLLDQLAAKADELVAKLRRVPAIVAGILGDKVRRLIRRIERLAQTARAAKQFVEQMVEQALTRLRSHLDALKAALTLVRKLGMDKALRLFRIVDAQHLAKLSQLEEQGLRRLADLEEASLRKAAALPEETLARLARHDAGTMRMVSGALSTAQMERLLNRFPDPEHLRQFLQPMRNQPPEVLREMLSRAERSDALRQAHPEIGPLGRNIASAEFHIQGHVGDLSGNSGRQSFDGTAGVPATRRFRTTTVSHDRSVDSEVKIFETLADRLDPQRAVTRANPSRLQGRVTLFSERPPCPSCEGVIAQFNELFPHVSVTVSYDTTRFLPDGFAR